MIKGVKTHTSGRSITYNSFKDCANRINTIYFYAPLKEDAQTYQGGLWTEAEFIGVPFFDGNGVVVNSANYIKNCGKNRGVGNSDNLSASYVFSGKESTFEAIFQRDPNMTGSAICIYGGDSHGFTITSASKTTLQIAHNTVLRGTIDGLDLTKETHIACVKTGTASHTVYVNGIQKLTYTGSNYESGNGFWSLGFSAG